MKEKLYTIPMNDAVNAEDECPFCYVERNVEQDLMDYVLGSGSSYMESDTRAKTDQYGFCREHFKKMHDYGNVLGNAWILKTHYVQTIREMERQFKSHKAVKISLKDRFGKSKELRDSVAVWTAQRDNSCYICNQFQEVYPRYLDTFFIMYEKDDEFRNKIKHSKGFCLHHFGDLCEAAQMQIPEKEKADFYNEMFQLMEENMNRVSEDVAWRVEKFDYLNADADWKNSRDAIPRGMQKLKGGYPADPIYKQAK